MDNSITDEVAYPTVMTSEVVLRTMMASLTVLAEAQRRLRCDLEDGSPQDAIQAYLESARRAIFEAQFAAQRLLDAAEGPDLPLFTGAASYPVEDDDTASESGSPVHRRSSLDGGRLSSKGRGVARASPLLPLAWVMLERLRQRLGPVATWASSHRAVATALILSLLPTGLCVALSGLIMGAFFLPLVVAVDLGLRYVGVQRVDAQLMADLIQAAQQRCLWGRLVLRRAAYWAGAEVRRVHGGPMGKVPSLSDEWPSSIPEATALLRDRSIRVRRRALFVKLVLLHVWRSFFHWAQSQFAPPLPTPRGARKSTS